ncbi:MAG: hypothetical protein K0R93_2627 [Anaerosolibacter sp.]|jgi:uncharacterized protein YlxW (UPF0749 family)|uniref:DUF881 domain-containing protein n=1 Tax=Anaerosolibacter sp. TaxID=1872527 RepID=UPI0026110EE8|nr:DUF881 domain-containing protein [Anaerosolibacter sp.]MDF2547729.1 hypothetical protein [Anaerosolibacter sp.]
MISLLRKNSLKFIVPIVAFLMVTGCTNVEKSVSLEQNMENKEILAGAVDVEGEGISIMLTDNETQINNPNNIIHDVDLTKIINLLTSAGAEVISINDERLISVSKIKANNMMIQINNNEYSSPFVIRAIGDSETLNNVLNAEESYLSLLREHIDIKIEKHEKLFIPKYTGNIHFNYAKSAEKK